MPAIGWCTTARIDPITGLVAFPDFHAEAPRILAWAAARGELVGFAIGDVDNLKEYVEDTNRTEPGSFGHLAGYAVMSHLGKVAGRWFREQRPRAGCVSTFGGDEIIVAMATDDAVAFIRKIEALRDHLRHALPRTVSFAVGVVGSSTPIAAPFDSGRSSSLYLRIMSMLDRCLFEGKAERRHSVMPAASFVSLVDLTAMEDSWGSHEG
jgi:GGDEF domain-containing protein